MLRTRSIEIPHEAVTAAAVALGAKIHWLNDQERANELARVALRAVVDSGWLIELPDEDDLRTVLLCGRCRAGAGGQCHTPSCALWMNRAPDVPVIG